MNAYIAIITLDGIKFKVAECYSDESLKRFRKEWAHGIMVAKKCGADVKLDVKQMYVTHVRQFGAENWSYQNEDWEDDPCLGCGGIGGGWVRECPDHCIGRDYHARLSAIANRFRPVVI